MTERQAEMIAVALQRIADSLEQIEMNTRPTA